MAETNNKTENLPLANDVNTKLENGIQFTKADGVKTEKSLLRKAIKVKDFIEIKKLLSGG